MRLSTAYKRGKTIQISVVTEHRRFEPENSVHEHASVCVCLCAHMGTGLRLQHQGNMVVVREESVRAALFVCASKAQETDLCAGSEVEA